MAGILSGFGFTKKGSDHKTETHESHNVPQSSDPDKREAEREGTAHRAEPSESRENIQLSTTNNRSRTMRLSKSTSGKDDDIDLPAEPVMPSSYTGSIGSSAKQSVTGISGNEKAPSAVIGAKISFKGELSGEEDLLIQGKVEGTIDLKGHQLTVGKQGVVKANLMAKTITIDGTVEGDLIAQERISIRASSNVKGNLIADRVTLEDGAKFRGSIDMESSKSSAPSYPKSSSSPAEVAEKS